MNFMYENYLYFAAGAAAFAVIVLLWTWTSRFKIVPNGSAIAIKTEEGVQRIILNSETLRGITGGFSESAVRGKREAKRFIYIRKDPNDEERRIDDSLMNPRTGAISLLVTQIDLPVFTAISSDQHRFRIHTTLRFRLSPKRLIRAFEYENVGQVLMGRLESEVRAQINKRENQKVGAAINTIRDAVKEELQKPETLDSQNFESWKSDNQALDKPEPEVAFFRASQNDGALGVRIIDVDIFPEVIDSPTYRAPLTDDGAAAEEATALGARGYTSVMDIPHQHLDNIRDMFLPNFENAREASDKQIKEQKKICEEIDREIDAIQIQIEEQARVHSTVEPEQPTANETLASSNETTETSPQPSALEERLTEAKERKKAADRELTNVKQQQQRENDTLVELEAKVYSEANASLLMMLEMFKEENIARYHAQGKPLVIMPQENSKDARTGLFRGMMGLMKEAGNEK